MLSSDFDASRHLAFLMRESASASKTIMCNVNYQGLPNVSGKCFIIKKYHNTGIDA